MGDCVWLLLGEPPLFPRGTALTVQPGPDLFEKDPAPTRLKTRCFVLLILESHKLLLDVKIHLAAFE